jgi:hypothetical protein
MTLEDHRTTEHFMVERYSFYEDPDSGQTLRFAEVAPPDPHEHEGQICGCTRAVATKPSTIHREVKQRLSFVSPGFEFPINTGQVTFGRLGDPAGHAYFWFRLPKEPSIQIEITLPGYGRSDHFFATLMKGNQCDSSQLFNGHSPSRVYDFSKIDPDALYLYSCGVGGREALRFFETPGEVALWNGAFEQVKIAQERVRLLSEDCMSPADWLRVQLEQDPLLREATLATRELLAPVAANLRDTELFKLGDEVRKRTSPGWAPTP